MIPLPRGKGVAACAYADCQAPTQRWFAVSATGYEQVFDDLEVVEQGVMCDDAMRVCTKLHQGDAIDRRCSLHAGIAPNVECVLPVNPLAPRRKMFFEEVLSVLTMTGIEDPGMHDFSVVRVISACRAFPRNVDVERVTVHALPLRMQERSLRTDDEDLATW